MALGVVLRDRVRDRLQHHRLAGLRRRHDQRPLPLADRHHQVDDPGGEHVRLGLQAQPLLRVERRELVELGAAPGLLRVHPVDRVQPDQRVGVAALPALGLAGCAHGTGHGVAAAQPVPVDLRHRHVRVIGPGQVPGRAHEARSCPGRPRCRSPVTRSAPSTSAGVGPGRAGRPVRVGAGGFAPRGSASARRDISHGHRSPLWRDRMKRPRALAVPPDAMTDGTQRTQWQDSPGRVVESGARTFDGAES